jgi:hypothetical protein
MWSAGRREALMRKLTLLVALLVVAVAVSAAHAAGGSPHFIKHDTFASLSGSSLVCNFKEAGIAAGSSETITCSASEAVTYECVNGGGRNPSASNKRTIQTTSSASGDFTADQNGNVAGQLTIAPADPASVGFSCPPGQTVTFVSVTYSNVTLTDTTSGATASLGGTFTYTNPDAPPVSG